MSDIGPGDVVQKVSGSNRFIRTGSIRRVEGLCHEDHGDGTEPGLIIGNYPKTRTYCRCFNPADWRKLNDGEDDAELIERIKACKPVRRKEPA